MNEWITVNHLVRKKTFSKTPVFVCNSSTISDNLMQFLYMWRGNIDVVESRVSNKQLNDTKDQRLYYVLRVVFIRRWRTYMVWPSPRPCLDWHSGRSVELLSECSNLIIAELCTGRHTTNSAFRLVGCAQQRGWRGGVSSGESRREIYVSLWSHVPTKGMFGKY